METQCLRLKLQEGKTSYFVNWVESLKARNEELIEVLRSAGISCEMLFLERSSDGDYVILYTKAKSLMISNATLMTSMRPIDKEARRMFQDAFEFTITRLESLIEVDV